MGVNSIRCTIDDPSITDEDGCMYELCQTVIPDHPVLKDHPEILLHDFEGGKYAVYHFKGKRNVEKENEGKYYHSIGKRK